MKLILRSATVEQFAHAEQVIIIALDQAAIDEKGINNERSKNPIMIYGDETIYDDPIDLNKD